MISHKNFVGVDRKALLSTLWIFVLFNLIFRDIHGFFRPGFLAKIMTGIVNGTEINDGVMLLGGIMAEIPISMVLLSRILNYSINRWANMVAGAITIASIVSLVQQDLDDLFFATIEIISLSVIIWLACQWRE